MTEQQRIDFYSLGDSGPQARLLFACRLAEKAWSQGVKVWLQVNDQGTAEELDNLLWSFRPDSFIPHALSAMLPELEDEEVPVIIGHEAECPVQEGLLVVLSESVPAFWQGFSRIAEIVPDDEDSRLHSRAHWTHYKNAGITPTHHKV